MNIPFSRITGQYGPAFSERGVMVKNVAPPQFDDFMAQIEPEFMVPDVVRRSFQVVKVGRHKPVIAPGLTGEQNCQQQLPGVCAETVACITFDWIEYTGKKAPGFLGQKVVNMVDPVTAEVLVPVEDLPVDDSPVSRPKYSKQVVSHSGFLFEVRETKVPFLKEIYTCWNTKDLESPEAWELCAIVKTDLRISAALADWCQVKLENKFCYMPGDDRIKFIQALNDELKIDFVHFTRLDVCADFQRSSYRNMSVQRFMEKLRKGDYVMARKKFKAVKSRSKHKALRSSIVAGMAGVDAMEKCKAKNTGDDFNIDDPVVEGRLGQVESLRFGKRSTGLSFQMYNKSLHMRSVEYKPWIAQHWKDSGKMIDGYEVYRLEFQKMKDVNDLDFDDDDVVLSFAHINILKYEELYFKALYKKHFHCAIFQPGVRFSRLKKVQLLDLNNSFYTIQRNCEKRKSNNYIKATLKMMLTDAALLRDGSDGDKIMASEIYRYAAKCVDRYDLSVWLQKHFPDVDFGETDVSYLDKMQQTQLRNRYFVHGGPAKKFEDKDKFTILAGFMGCKSAMNVGVGIVNNQDQKSKFSVLAGLMGCRGAARVRNEFAMLAGVANKDFSIQKLFN